MEAFGERGKVAFKNLQASLDRLETKREADFHWYVTHPSTDQECGARSETEAQNHGL